jgi:predicted RNA-binding protein with PIN domain
LSKNIEVACERLCESLRVLHDVEEIRVTVVFDGRGKLMDAAARDPEGSFCVVYAPEGMTADAVIEQMVFRSTAPIDCTVASRDNSVCQSVLAAGGRVMSPDALHERLESCRLRADRAMQSRSRKSDGEFGNRLFS